MSVNDAEAVIGRVVGRAGRYGEWLWRGQVWRLCDTKDGSGCVTFLDHQQTKRREAEGEENKESSLEPIWAHWGSYVRVWVDVYVAATEVFLDLLDVGSFFGAFSFSSLSCCRLVVASAQCAMDH